MRKITTIILWGTLCGQLLGEDVATDVDRAVHASAGDATAAIVRLTSRLTGSDARQRSEAHQILVAQLAQSQAPQDINRLSSLIALSADDTAVLIALRRSAQAQDERVRFSLLLGLHRMLQPRPRLSPSTTQEIAGALLAHVNGGARTPRDVNLAVQTLALLDNGFDLLVTLRNGPRDLRSSCALYTAIGKTRHLPAVALLRRELEAAGPESTHRVQIASAIGELFRALRGMGTSVPADETTHCRTLMINLSQDESLDLQEASLRTLAAIDPDDAWLQERIAQTIEAGTDAQKMAALHVAYELPRIPPRALPVIAALAERVPSGDMQDVAAAIRAKQIAQQETP